MNIVKHFNKYFHEMNVTPLPAQLFSTTILYNYFVKIWGALEKKITKKTRLSSMMVGCLKKAN
jgi:hypothetical protein